MGFIDFVKNAGQRLKGDGGSELTDPEAIAARIRADVEKLGFGAEGLEVTVAGDRVTLRGKAHTPVDRQKIVLIAGNTYGVAGVDDQLTVAPGADTPPAAEANAPAAEPAPEPTYYTVVSGDTLSKIAKAHYGDAMKYPAIFEANRPMLEDPDKIYPGQMLRIPPVD